MVLNKPILEQRPLKRGTQLKNVVLGKKQWISAIKILGIYG